MRPLRNWLLVAAGMHLGTALFSVSDDVFVLPQYELEWSLDFVTPEDRRVRDPGHTIMTQGKQSFLCTVPKVDRAPMLNSSELDVIKRQEAQELSRAVDRGWKLLAPLEGGCLYFISGWWTYAFCYNDVVKQFHQLPPQNGLIKWPPQEDPHSETYVLGRPENEQVEVGVSGEVRYLVQKYGEGTACDLTGRERRIEVQFHCSTAGAEKIAWVKEVTTCSYVMVVYTPRLCEDMTFIPERSAANQIRCAKILTEEEQEKEHAWLQQQLAEAARMEEEAARARAEAKEARERMDQDKRRETHQLDIAGTIARLAKDIEQQITEGTFLTPHGKLATGEDVFSYDVALVGDNEVVYELVTVFVDGGKVKIEVPARKEQGREGAEERDDGQIEEEEINDDEIDEEDQVQGEGSVETLLDPEQGSRDSLDGTAGDEEERNYSEGEEEEEEHDE